MPPRYTITLLIVKLGYFVKRFSALADSKNGIEVTAGQWQIPKPISNPNQPIEDLFLNFEGIYVPGGIFRIHFRDFREVDHLTYGYAIPEPSPSWLAAAAGLWLLRRRRSA